MSAFFRVWLNTLTTIADYIGLRGSFGQQHCNPRTLRSNQIGRMVSLEGIVTRCKSSTSFVYCGW